MIITIGGLAGSGTSTTASILSNKIGYPQISAGDIFRQMAEDKGKDLMEFSKFAEGNTEIDLEIDQRQAQIAQKSEDLIVEGRLSAYFINADLKVWCTAPMDVRAQRISQREDKTIQMAREEIISRERSETHRYLEIHNINIHEMEIYHLIINTHAFKADSVAEIILKVAEVIKCQQ
jgi:cytidylate kinase